MQRCKKNEQKAPKMQNELQRNEKEIVKCNAKNKCKYNLHRPNFMLFCLFAYSVAFALHSVSVSYFVCIVCPAIMQCRDTHEIQKKIKGR
jgi:hypothetical protein